MSERPAVRGEGAAEREWRERIEGRLTADHDCTRLAGELEANRRALEGESEADGSDRRKWAVRALVVVAIPLIAYSELTATGGAINYGGMGIGVVLMLAGWLAYL